jgi:hypothetical protein
MLKALSQLAIPHLLAVAAADLWAALVRTLELDYVILIRFPILNTDE